MKKKDLIEWIKSRPAISVTQIGVEAGYKNGQYFRKYLSNPNRMEANVPPVLWGKVLPVLIKYGLSYE